MTIELLGIKTCDTVKKSLKWWKDRGIAVEYVDLILGISPAFATELFEAFGEKVINKSSRTWRLLSDEDKQRDPVELLSENPTLAKRPIIRINGAWKSIGFQPELWEEFV
ncbi:MAG: arsenate reductase [Gammaproteobacteria bacterium]|nr:arsenate reductase [Gammaproteobacteria bacterium]